MEIKEKVLHALREAESPLKAGEIAEIIGEEKSEVDKVIKLLKKDEEVISPKRCYYQINE
ncbi:MarR family transcriptional regulator [Clostridium cylindrosporum]|uniref:MarR family transcriptional regulator n=1 Tax=Clostridium cylindrosporum DSM 605 TaxID=1121307 RepID=A0A0J8D610_CLOCY|nr:MarR family transcriptional regulator [Clostridium cylindrosporum]KMT21530.1 hypothetical protein CLCY_2c02920 [Clostridium cylindrosporum DSM 605]